MEITPDILHMFLYGRLERQIDNLLEEQRRIAGYPDPWAPREVCILPSTIPGEGLGVFSTCCLKVGTEMGPFPGRMFSKYPDQRVRISTNAWEILNKDGTLMAYVDGGLPPNNNWLAYVQCARTDREQNLEVVQIGNHVHYRATKDIDRGEELLVWYGKSYSMYMGVPYAKSRTHCAQSPVPVPIKETRTKDDAIPDHQVDGKWRCVLCKRGFNSRSNLRSHMRIHTLERPFVCKFCGRKFSQSSTLRNHVRLHTGEKPYKCIRCKSSYSQLAGLRAHQRSSTHKPTSSLSDTDFQHSLAEESNREPGEIDVSD